MTYGLTKIEIFYLHFMINSSSSQSELRKNVYEGGIRIMVNSLDCPDQLSGYFFKRIGNLIIQHYSGYIFQHIKKHPIAN